MDTGGPGVDAEAATLVVRCECGAMIGADSEDELIRRTQLHLGEFHPDLGGNMPADAILAMVEQKGGNRE